MVCSSSVLRCTGILLLTVLTGLEGCSKDAVIKPKQPVKVWTVLDSPYDVSPNGQMIAFGHLNQVDFSIDTYILTVPQLGTSLLFESDSLDASGLRFSPDGTRIALTKDATRDIYVFNFGTNALDQLTYTNGNARSPDWDPTGRYIVYVRPFRPYGQPDSLSGLFIVDTETLIDRPLTHNGSPTFGDNPRWSPDGKTIVFTFYGVNHAMHIFRLGVDGSGYSDLTPGDVRNNDYPIWFSSGQQILYESFDEHTFATHETRVMSQYGQSPAKWHVDIRPYTNSAVSRDETYFVFSAPDSSDKYLVLFRQDLQDAAGSTRKQLTTVPYGVAPTF